MDWNQQPGCNGFLHSLREEPHEILHAFRLVLLAPVQCGFQLAFSPRLDEQLCEEMNVVRFVVINPLQPAEVEDGIVERHYRDRVLRVQQIQEIDYNLMADGELFHLHVSRVLDENDDISILALEFFKASRQRLSVQLKGCEDAFEGPHQESDVLQFIHGAASQHQRQLLASVIHTAFLDGDDEFQHVQLEELYL